MWGPGDGVGPEGEKQWGDVLEAHLPGQPQQFLLMFEESRQHLVRQRPDPVGVLQQVDIEDAGIRAAADQAQPGGGDVRIVEQVGDLTDVDPLGHGRGQGGRAENDIEPFEQRRDALERGAQQVAPGGDLVAYVLECIPAQLGGRRAVFQQDVANAVVKNEDALLQEIDVCRL